MKPMNTMFKSTVLACALTASLSALAEGGGGDGGKIKSEYGMAGQTVANNLLKSKDPAVYALQSLEFGWQLLKAADFPGLPATRQKLFGEAVTVYQALREATLIPTNDEHVCDGLPEKDPDACAFPDAKKIYFIIPRIVNEQVKNQSGHFQLVALVAHEAVHLIKGTTEEEAQLVQDQIQPSLSSGVYEAFPGIPEHINEALKNGYDFTKTAQTYVRKSTDKFCDQLIIAFMSLSEASNVNFETNDTSGVLIISNKAVWLLAAASAKVKNLFNACDNVGRDPKEAALFQNRSSVPLAEYYRATMAVDPANTPADNYNLLPDVRIRRVSKGATGAINAELQDVLNLLAKVPGTK
jgi:hypothetical protein